MLELKNIKKVYLTGDFEQNALKDINLKFRKNEFVTILGPSGSGKTTMLNIIGGLDRYTSGDLIINGKSTKEFKDKDWDAYRNNSIGFVFQNYNLISHISVLANVEMGLTLNGVSASKRKKRALELLDKVGLKKHAHKKPNQLSGGEQQRVCIARSLANNPDIILADEPTGALDSKTSVQILELIKEIAQDKLVIMVSHNEELAREYSTRIINVQDGVIINDSKEVKEQETLLEDYNLKKTKMNFMTALKLSFNNIITKKWRTILISFAASIGIIGISLILSLSNGFQIQIDDFEKKSLSSLPILVTEQAMNLDADTLAKMTEEEQKFENYPKDKVIYSQSIMSEEYVHTNILTEDYVDYINKLDSNLVAGISYSKMTSINAIIKNNDKYEIVDTNKLAFVSLPKKLNDNGTSYIENQFDLLAGKYPEDKEDIVVILDSKNRISSDVLTMLGFKENEDVNFDKILNKEFKIVFNDDYYTKQNGYWTLNNNYEKLYNNKNNLTVKISGIVRGKKENKIYQAISGLSYTDELIDTIIKNNKDSKIVKDQIKLDYNILTGQKFATDDEKKLTLNYLGNDGLPSAIYIYSAGFDEKDKILTYLDKYNDDLEETDQIIYQDYADLISGLSKNIMNAITIVLIAFSSISLVVSSIMIGIITYISVLERTKEIGILRALGARKKDITRVFNAENFIIGLCSGILGVLITRLLLFPTNAILYNLTDLENIAKMNIVHVIILIIVSLTLTIISGMLPARGASKKDPVIALRTE